MTKYLVKESWIDGSVTYLTERMWSTKDKERAMRFTEDDLISHWNHLKSRESRKMALVPDLEVVC